MDDFIKRFITFVVCLALLLFAAVKMCMGQELPKEPASKFITEDGRIFWHKSVPYYVFISDDSTGNNAALLHSKNQAKYSNPAYFDTYGRNYIRTKWAVDKETGKTIYPQQEILWEVFVDGTPPFTKPEFTSKNAYLVNGTRYFTSDLTMVLKSEDKDSGVKSIYYSMNDSTYIKYDKPVILNPKDTFHIKYFAVDMVGNYEKVKIFKYDADDYSIKYAIDAYAPVTTISQSFLRGRYLGPNVEISFTAKDKGSGVAFINYAIDDGDLQVYDKPFTLDLAEGFHKIRYFAVDYITNKEEDNVKEFYFDRSKPTVFISASHYHSEDSVMYINDSTKIKLEAYDPRGIKKIAYKFTDDKAYRLYDDVIIMPKGYKDQQILKYFATDSVDNDSEIHTIKLHRDTKPPVLKFVLTGPYYERGDTTYVTNNTQFSVVASDETSGISNNKVIVNGEYVKKVEFKIDTMYHVIDTLIDHMGNFTTLEKLYSCDSNAPNIEFVFSNPALIDGTSVYPNGTILFFTVTDFTGISSLKATVNGKPITGTTFIGKPGVYKAEIWAVDWLKQSSMKSIEFTIR